MCSKFKSQHIKRHTLTLRVVLSRQRYLPSIQRRYQRRSASRHRGMQRRNRGLDFTSEYVAARAVPGEWIWSRYVLFPSALDLVPELRANRPQHHTILGANRPQQQDDMQHLSQLEAPERCTFLQLFIPFRQTIGILFRPSDL